MAIALASGCSDWMPEVVPYGSVTAPDYYRSLNGLGNHKKLWETAGAKVLTPQKLSPRLESMDAIVLVGQSYDPPGNAARDWLEEWLSHQPGRTVIYFGRDFNAEIYFRQQTLGQLPAEGQLRGEEMLALSQAKELKLRLRQVAESAYCNWFYLDADVFPQRYQSFSGDWAVELPSSSGEAGWPVGIVLQPPDEERWQARQPSWLQSSAIGASGQTADVSAGKQAGSQPNVEAEIQSDSEFEVETLVEESVWDPQELDTVEKWKLETHAALDSETLLAADDGQPLIFRLTDDRFPQSQILIVANGAPFLNGSLVEPLHRAVGERIIEACLPAKRVALLVFDESGLVVSHADEQDTRGAGLEMLTVWPLSAITMPAALLGIVSCAALIPILGRPRRLPRGRVSDFGLHIEAIGRMLERPATSSMPSR
jgi:hypothetical protein